MRNSRRLLSSNTLLIRPRHDSLNPTLSAPFVAGEMVRIICSGLSDHLVTPHFAGFVLPAVRCLPEWFRVSINALGKTNDTITDAGNAESAKTYTFVGELDKLHGVS